MKLIGLAADEGSPAWRWFSNRQADLFNVHA
jgi:hypothetical protein